MIKDRIENINLYQKLSVNLGNAIRCVEQNNFIVHGGEFVIFFPTDGHKPSLHVENAIGRVRKVVFKVEAV